MNKFIGIGNTVYDLEGRDVAGKVVANGVLAIKREYAPDKVDFIKFTVWGKLAETTLKYCGKGSLISIVGELQTQKKNETIYTKINVESLRFLQTKAPNGTQEKKTFTKPQETQYHKETADFDFAGVETEISDLPF
jgi:single-strand DNA-binding protein